MKLSIVIVNYNVRYFLEQCLISVKRALKDMDAEVFVVDNDSSDGSCSLIRQKFPWVKLMGNEVNVGFSKANNQAIGVASGEYILLLNPDTVVAEDTFERCISFMDAHPDAGALGVRMIDGKGNFLPESKRGLPTPDVAFYKMFGLSWLFPKSKTFGKYHLGYLPEHGVHEAEILSGAYMFMRKEALDKVGLLDESFFMYGEDIDLSYRIVKGGYKNYYFPETTIIHYKGESTKKGSLNYIKVFYNAMILFAKKHFSGNQSTFFSFLINMAVFFRGILTVMANLFSSSFLFIIDALLSFGGIFFIKIYWENTIKYADDYYPAQFLFIVVPSYIFIWILSTFISGGYDKPFRVSNIIRGIFIGTLAIAAVYAFLPNEWRFSRAIIILGAMWTTFEMLLTRMSYHLILHQTLSIEGNGEKRCLLVGGADESARAEKLLLLSGADADVVSKVDNTADLERLAQVYEVNEVVFCSRDLSFNQIMNGIARCGHGISYKILNEASDAFIGSNSKNTAGDLYSFHHSLNLARPVNQRKKRLFDILICILLIPMMPVNVFAIRSFGGFLSNYMQVLLGQKTWVGYAQQNASLPVIKEGAITASENVINMNLDAKVLANLDLLYARHYSVRKDISILLKNYSKLGR